MPAAVLSILVQANTGGASASLTRLDRQLKGTAATANKSTAAIATGAGRAVLGLGVLGGASLVAAAKYEHAFADVRKTVNASEREFERLEKGILNMSKRIPVSAVELAHLAGEAGALGVKTKDLLRFTRVAADLGVATDLSAEEAANALARLSNILDVKGRKAFERMGSTLVDLGNKGASTESEISEMALRIARAAGIVGLSADQVLGLSASLANVGVRAEAGGSSVGRALLAMNEAIATGGAELKRFADVAGLSVDAFTRKFRDDAPGALDAFARGLQEANANGEPLMATLEGVGLNEIRVREALLALGGAQEKVSRGQQIANKAWGENSALVEEANKRYKTSVSQFELLKNRAFALGVSFGHDLLPQLNDVMKSLGKGDLGGAIEKMAELGGRMGVRLAGAIGKAFLDADILGKLAIGGALISALGGRGAWKALGKSLGTPMGRGLSLGIIAGLLLLDEDIRKEAKKVLTDVQETITGELLGQTDREAFAQELQGWFDVGLGAIKFQGRDKVRVATEWGKLIFSTETGKVIKAGTDKLKKFVGESAQNVVTGLNSPTIRQAFKPLADSAARHGGRASQVYGEQWDEILGTTKRKGGQTFQVTDQQLGKAASAGRDHSGDLRKGVVGNVDAMVGGVGGGVRRLSKGLSSALESLGVKKQTYIAFEAGRGDLPQGKMHGGIIRAAKGAIVPGTAPGDRVPVHLAGRHVADVESGELLSVTNKTATAKQMAWNAAFPRKLAEGGTLGGPFQTREDVLGAGPGFVPYMNYLNSLFGPLNVISGLRPGSITTSGNLSNHAWGGAVDISTPGGEGATSSSPMTGAMGSRMDAAHRWIASKFAPINLDLLWRTLTGGNHYNHIHSGIARSHSFNAQAMSQFISKLPKGEGFGELARMLLRGPDGPLKDMGNAALSHVWKAANAHLGKKAMTPGFGMKSLGNVHGETFMSSAYGPPWGGIQGTGTTYTGVDLTSGPKAYGVAVDPSVIPLGSKLRIGPNPFDYGGAFKAFDTGGAIQGNRIDFYDWRGRDSQNAWGMREVQVEALREGGILDPDKVVRQLQGAAGPGERRDIVQTARERVNKRTALKFLSQDGSELGGVLKDLRAKADEYASNADFAASLGLTDDDGNLIPGSDVFTSGNLALGQAGWIGEELGALFGLRNELVVSTDKAAKKSRAIAKILKRIKGPKGLIAQINERIRAIKKRIEDLEDARKELEDALKKASDNKERSQKLIQAKLDKELEKPKDKQDKQQIAQWRKQLRSKSTEKEGIREDLGLNRRQTREANAALAKQTTVRDTVRGPLSGVLDARKLALDDGAALLSEKLFDVQGSGVTVDWLPELPPLGTLKGEIGTAQLALRDLGATQPSITDTAPDMSELLDIERQLRIEAQQALAVQTAQFDVLRATPEIGAFAKGGWARGLAWVGEEGRELVDFGSRGAQVRSNPESEAIAAGGDVVVIVNGDIVNVPRGKPPIEVRRGDRDIDATLRRTGRNAGRGLAQAGRPAG